MEVVKMEKITDRLDDEAPAGFYDDEPAEKNEKKETPKAIASHGGTADTKKGRKELWPMKERIFFWGIFFLTLLHISLIVAPAFGYQGPPSFWTECYLVILGIYAGVRRWSQFGRKNNYKRNGQYFVIIYWYVGGLLCLYGVYWCAPVLTNLTHNSQELWSTIKGVVYIYGGADLFKRIGESRVVQLCLKALEKYLKVEEERLEEEDKKREDT
jgi:hypothetical protein